MADSAQTYDRVLSLLDELSGEDETVRQSAFEQLGAIGVAAVPALLDAIDGSLRAEGAAQTVQWIKARRGAAIPLILIALAWAIATGTVMLGTSGAMLAVICAPTVAAAYLGLTLLRSNRLERTTRRAAYAREVLRTITDASAINPLAERLNRGQRIASAEAAWVIERLLPQVSAEEWNSVLSTATKRRLAKVVVLSNADEHPRLLVELLNAMARAGDTRVHYDISTIAAAKATSATEHMVIEAAIEYMYEVEQSIDKHKDKATLLRGSNSPSEALVRPATAIEADSKLLLRPTSDPDNPA